MPVCSRPNSVAATGVPGAYADFTAPLMGGA